MSIRGKLLKKILIKGTIKALTGLHIGGSNPGISIGGADAVVVRNPLNNQPYIPGSSLKGKMRSLTERLFGKFSKSNITAWGPYMGNPQDIICELYGITPDDAKKALKIEKQEDYDAIALPSSRLIVRDCALTVESARKLFNSKATDMPYTEIKTEVVIDRITSAATPRQLERVPAGAEFDMNIILNIYDSDDENNLLNKIFMALALVQNDYLGGKGTRGSGEIKIAVEPLLQKGQKDYEENKTWQSHDFVIPTELRKEQKA